MSGCRCPSSRRRWRLRGRGRRRVRWRRRRRLGGHDEVDAVPTRLPRRGPEVGIAVRPPVIRLGRLADDDLIPVQVHLRTRIFTPRTRRFGGQEIRTVAARLLRGDIASEPAEGAAYLDAIHGHWVAGRILDASVDVGRRRRDRCRGAGGIGPDGGPRRMAGWAPILQPGIDARAVRTGPGAIDAPQSLADGTDPLKRRQAGCGNVDTALLCPHFHDLYYDNSRSLRSPWSTESTPLDKTQLS